MQFITIIIQRGTAYQKPDQPDELYGGTKGKGGPGKDKSAGQHKSARQQQTQDKTKQDKDKNGDRRSTTEKYDHRKHSR